MRIAVDEAPVAVGGDVVRLRRRILNFMMVFSLSYFSGTF